jgi:hypothetical protein
MENSATTNRLPFQFWIIISTQICRVLRRSQLIMFNIINGFRRNNVDPIVLRICLNSTKI